ncbi:MAG: S9 family peptidase [Chloroflexi bacterium]|nr:S9 family peptidase [Chloroflexota bacterium]
MTAPPIAQAAVARRPVEPTDNFRLRFLQSGALSPDGAWIVYPLEQVDPITEVETITLWMVATKNAAIRRLTSGTAKDTNPAWSPDGTQIAFISDRGEHRQIFLIDANGGEAEPLTTLPRGVTGWLNWSPDGSKIAFNAGPQGAPRAESQPFIITRPVYRFDILNYLDDVAADIYVVEVATGAVTQLTDDGSHNVLPRWSPNGREILYIAMLNPDTHIAVHSRIRTVDLAGGVRELAYDWGLILAAEWLPDGQQIAFIGQPADAAIGTDPDLWVMDRFSPAFAGAASEQLENRTAAFALPVAGTLQNDMPTTELPLTNLVIAENGGADGQSVVAYTKVQDRGAIHIYTVALSGPESVRPLVTGDRACILQDVGAKQLVYAVSTSNQTPDLYVADLDGTNERRLTNINEDALAGLILTEPPEHLLFPSSDGVEVEGWLLKPTTGDPAPYPTVLYIHGGPHTGFGHIFHFDFQMLAGAGYAVLYINHRGSSGYGDTFANQTHGAWGQLDYDDLMAGVDHAIARGLVDPDRMGCCGISGGGNLSCWIVGQTDRFKAAVPENPVTDWVSFYGTSDIGPWFSVKELGGHPHEIPEVYRNCSPITYAHRCTTPTLLLQGENDWRCPANQSEAFYTILKVNGCVAALGRIPACSHGGSRRGDPIMRRFQNEMLLGWMNRYLLDIDPDSALG